MPQMSESVSAVELSEPMPSTPYNTPYDTPVSPPVLPMSDLTARFANRSPLPQITDSTMMFSGLVGRKRKRHDHPSIDESTALKIFDDHISSSGCSPEAAILTLLRTYDISESIFDTLRAEKLKFSLSKAKYKDIAPLFGLDPTDKLLSDIPQFTMHRSWIPVDIVRNICHDVDIADVQYGQMITHSNEKARSRYIATLFNRIVYLFRRKITNLPEELTDGNITKSRVEHQFIAFGAVVVVFIQVKKELMTGRSRQDQVAQVMIEVVACDFQNTKQGLSVPILGILRDSEKFEFFIFNAAEEGQRFKVSKRMFGLQQDDDDPLKFLGSIKKTEYFYDFFLIGYINGLQAYVNRSLETTRMGRKRESASQWQASLAHAQHAWNSARHATTVASVRGEYDYAEHLAKVAVERLEESIEAAPASRAPPSAMEVWDAGKVVRASMRD